MAAVAWRESRRRPGSLVSSLVIGVLMAGLLLLIGVVGDLVEGGTDDRTYTVAVGGDLVGASVLLGELERDDQLSLEPSDDPGEDVVRRRAAAGLVLPEGLDQQMADGRTSRLEMHRRVADSRSFQAFALLGVRIQEVERAHLVGPDQADPPLEVGVDPVLRDERVARVQYGGYMGAVAALLCVGVVTGSAAFFGSARQRRSVEPLLALPVRRWALVTGTAAGSWPMGAVQIAAGLVMLLIVAALPVTTWAQPPGALLAMGTAALATGALLAVLASAAGALAGCLGTGSDDAVSVGDLLALPFVVAGIALFLAPDAATGAWVGLVPVYGQAALVREAVIGSPDLGLLAVSVASTIFWASVLVVFAARVVSDERRLVRSTR